MSPEIIAHYETRLNEAADLYEREPTVESAWALVSALAMARLYHVPARVYDQVVTAFQPYELELLKAALSSVLEQNYAAMVEDWAASADYGVHEWECEARGFEILHFELQAAHDWIADRVLRSEAMLPSLIRSLEEFGSATAELAAAIQRHWSLFSVTQELRNELLTHADQSLLTAAYQLTPATRAARKPLAMPAEEPVRATVVRPAWEGLPVSDFLYRLSDWIAGLFPSLALQATYADAEKDEVVKTFPRAATDLYEAQLVQDTLGRWFLRVFTKDVEAAKLKVRLDIEPEAPEMHFTAVAPAMFFAEVRLSEGMANALKSGHRPVFRAME